MGLPYGVRGLDHYQHDRKHGSKQADEVLERPEDSTSALAGRRKRE